MRPNISGDFLAALGCYGQRIEIGPLGALWKVSETIGGLLILRTSAASTTSPIAVTV